MKASDGTAIATFRKCHSGSYVSGRESALSLAIKGSENDFLMVSAEPVDGIMVYCKYTPAGIEVFERPNGISRVVSVNFFMNMFTMAG